MPASKTGEIDRKPSHNDGIGDDRKGQEPRWAAASQSARIVPMSGENQNPWDPQEGRRIGAGCWNCRKER